MESTDGATHEVKALAEAIKPILAGKPAAVQGAVIAELLATWLGGHYAGDRTSELRAELLNMHVDMVLKLLEAEEGLTL